VNPWGFQVGDVVVLVEGEGPRSVMSPFEPVDPPTLRLAASACETVSTPPGELVREDLGWGVFTRGGDDVSFVLTAPLLGTPEFARVDLDPSGHTGRLVYRRGLELNPLAWQPLSVMLVLDALARSGGLMMHAAALGASGGAFLLAGPSGAGKTTLSLACASQPGALILSDERPVVRRTPTGWVVDGTPWPGEGEFVARATLPLRGLMLLEQASEDRIDPISPARAMALLYRCTFTPFWRTDGARAALSSLEQLVREVPAFRLRSRKGGDAPRLLLERLASA
jgi:hypothetical protein